MNNNLSDITIVLDESGSMGAVRDDTIGGLNAFIYQQRLLPGECNLTIYKFAYHTRKMLPTTSLRGVAQLTTDQYAPVGGTALYDAMHTAISETGARLASMPESQRPGKVLIVTLTDGMENSSKFANAWSVKNMKEHQEKVYNWQFIYLGASHDSFAQGATLGFLPDYVDHRKEYTSGGILLACTNASNATSNYRGGGSAAVNTTGATNP
jgi:hypothetical protein